MNRKQQQHCRLQRCDVELPYRTLHRVFSVAPATQLTAQCWTKKSTEHTKKRCGIWHIKRLLCLSLSTPCLLRNHPLRAPAQKTSHTKWMFTMATSPQHFQSTAVYLRRTQTGSKQRHRSWHLPQREPDVSVVDNRHKIMYKVLRLIYRIWFDTVQAFSGLYW